jgi:hypothetical protein
MTSNFSNDECMPIEGRPELLAACGSTVNNAEIAR